MKKLFSVLVLSTLVAAAVPALAADKQALNDKVATMQLSAIESRKAMLALCGVTGDEAAQDLATDNAKAAELQASLSDDAKKALPDKLAKIDAGVKTSWDNTPEDLRAKSCDALKAKMAAGK